MYYTLSDSLMCLEIIDISNYIEYVLWRKYGNVMALVGMKTNNVTDMPHSNKIYKNKSFAASIIVMLMKVVTM